MPETPSIGREHLVFEEERMDRRDRTFGAIPSAHHDRTPDLVLELASDGPSAIDEGLELGGNIVEIHWTAQNHRVGCEEHRCQNPAHIIVNRTFVPPPAGPTGLAGLDLIIGELYKLPAGDREHQVEQTVCVAVLPGTSEIYKTFMQ